MQLFVVMWLIVCRVIACRDTGYIEDLELHRLMGRGGFGSVFSGNWKGSAAAIKVRRRWLQQCML
jgi:predicted Ser/Thr protein kinase